MRALEDCKACGVRRGRCDARAMVLTIAFTTFLGTFLHFVSIQEGCEEPCCFGELCLMLDLGLASVLQFENHHLRIWSQNRTYPAMMCTHWLVHFRCT
jgi:hypothetical protein